MTDGERDRRSASQWLRSIHAYLEFRASLSWRRLSTDRWHPDRVYYLDGIRTLNGIGTARPVPIHILNKKTDDLRAAKLEIRPRAELVSELMRAKPALTDRKLLLRLSRPKLARMLLSALDSRRLLEMERGS